MKSSAELWSIFEAVFEAKIDGNPFTDVEFSAIFKHDDRTVRVPGFYDGDGIFRVRFMPDSIGEWSFETSSNIDALDKRTGKFTATAPTGDNHGPVRVRDKFHFGYADGSLYHQIGTTCYAWMHQNKSLQQQTLRTLDTAPFNKLRMCILPKWYPFNHVEPDLYPFEGESPDKWDFSRLNPAYFQHIDRCVLELQKRGIEADLILFHPYDDRWEPGQPAGAHWGFDRMGAQNDDRYLRYVVARFAAHRNVWWSLANEWDFVKSKNEADWIRFGEIVKSSDPYGHLLSIHNGPKLFDHSLPWITHVSLQGENIGEAFTIRNRYDKPLIYDECCYEGDIEHDWGNISAEKLVSNFWKTFVSGAYCGHGETFFDPNEELWWAKGGELHGQSKERLEFFRSIISAAPINADRLADTVYGVEGEYYLAYFGDRQPCMRHIQLADGHRFSAELIDTWEMTTTPLPGEYSGYAKFDLPRKPYMALRITRA